MLKDIQKAIKYNQTLDVVYMASDGSISKRRIKPFSISKSNIKTYCYLRKSTRTFRIDNILALVPVVKKESMVI